MSKQQQLITNTGTSVSHPSHPPKPKVQTSRVVRRRSFEQSTTTHQVDYETTDTVSQTIPDQTMSISEMLQRTKRGLPINSGRQPIYNGEKLLPDWQKLDLIDRAKIVELAAADVKAKQARRDKQIAAVKAKAAAAKAASEKPADQGSPVQRTSGEGSEQGT